MSIFVAFKRLKTLNLDCWKWREVLKSTTVDFDLPQQLLNSSDKVFESCRFLCSIRNYISISQYDTFS